MEKLILIAVYDSLRLEGSEGYIYLDKKQYLGIYYTEPIYDLYSINKTYGGIVKNGNTSVLTEIYLIDETDLSYLEFFYGMVVTGYNSLYKQETIQTPYGECLLYIYDRPVTGKPKIESGDYIKWKENIKKEIKTTEEFTSRHGIE